MCSQGARWIVFLGIWHLGDERVYSINCNLVRSIVQYFAPSNCFENQISFMDSFDCFRSCYFDTFPADFFCSSAVFEPGNKNMVCTQSVLTTAIITQYISKLQFSVPIGLPDLPHSQIMLTTTASNSVNTLFYFYYLRFLLKKKNNN